jgi:hypothetical protein
MNRRGIELSFGWIFSLIVGGAILFLAIYAAIQFGGEERRIQETFTAQELVTRFSALTTTLESASRPGNLSFATETRITPLCTLEDMLGMQEVRVASRSGIGAAWDDAGVPAKAPGLYLFSAKQVYGKEFNILVKPILLPFKIGDSITLWSSSYCFVQPPRDIEDELAIVKGAGHPIVITSKPQDCVRNSTVVCFTTGGVISGTKSACQVFVDVEQRSVEKQGQKVFYIEPLIYAAIFSEPQLYECNVKRLLKRAEFLSSLYQDKSAFIASRGQGCSSALQADIETYRTIAQNGTSRSLASLEEKALELDSKNPDACRLWQEKMR